MKILELLKSGVVVLELHGKILIGEGEDLLRETVQHYTQNWQQRALRGIVIDLSDVPYIDASGLGTLVRAFTSAGRVGARFVLCNPSKKIRNLLEVTKLLNTFNIYDTRDEAITSF